MQNVKISELTGYSNRFEFQGLVAFYSTFQQMKKEAQELGFDPWGDSAQEEFERRVTDLEQQVLENPEDDLEIMFYEQVGFS